MINISDIVNLHGGCFDGYAQTSRKKQGMSTRFQVNLLQNPLTIAVTYDKAWSLNKLDNYNFNDSKKILTETYKSYPDGDIDDKDFVKKFLKRCHEVGIKYAKSK